MNTYLPYVIVCYLVFSIYIHTYVVLQMYRVRTFISVEEEKCEY